MDSTTDADKKNMYFKIIVSCVTYFVEFDVQIFAIVNSFECDSLLWLKGYFMLKISPLTDFCVHDRTWNLFALVVV